MRLMNKRGDLQALSLVLFVPAIALFMILFYVFVGLSIDEPQVKVQRTALSNTYARAEVFEFLNQPVAGVPRWMLLPLQPVDDVKAQLTEFYSRTEGVSVHSVTCAKTEPVLHCELYLKLNVPYEDLVALTPGGPLLFAYRASAAVLSNEFVNERVVLPLRVGQQADVLVFELKGVSEPLAR
ncbi:hypothetical protein HY489_04230 [Candidatus Woesearchaeota archaeon]|nr:hypothetical protein [Candidatus Woesearchaeota archaeon]